MSRNNVILQPNAIPSIIPQQEFDPTNYAQIFANLDAKNQQANALNARLEQRQRDGRTPLDDWRDKRIAEIQAQKHDPIFLKEQEKKDNIINAQGLAKALLGTKQVESMTYGGNPVKQSPDGKYWLENGQEVTDTANIQTNNKFDPIAGSLEALKSGNPLALQALQEQMKPKQGMGLEDRLALVQAQANAKASVDALKPKKDTDGKMSELSKTKDIVGELTPWFGDNQFRTNEVSNIVNQGLLDPQLKNADVLEALNQAKAASSQWYKGKTDVDTDLLAKLLNQYKNK